jgi:hypothetical protein
MSGTNYYMNLAFVIGSFLVPWALLMVPLIALTMQVWVYKKLLNDIKCYYRSSCDGLKSEKLPTLQFIRNGLNKPSLDPLTKWRTTPLRIFFELRRKSALHIALHRLPVRDIKRPRAFGHF